MSENLYYKILSVDPEVFNPDYYQMLLIYTDNPTPQQIERQYKTQMSKVQNVRSTKYKDFIEFLKGELKQARRILNDPKLKERYDNDRKKESSEKLSDIVEMFIQISGNLSEIEIREIHRQGNHFNLMRKEIDKIIDENLNALGCKRMKATPAQLKRASDILNRRANIGIVSESQLLYLTENGYTTEKPEEYENDKKSDSDVKKVEQLKKDAQQLNQLAEFKIKYKPLFMTLKITNLVFNLAGWILVFGILAIILFLKGDQSVVDGVRSVFGIEPETIIEKVPIPSNNIPPPVEKTELEKFKESYLNPDSKISHNQHLAESKSKLEDLCREYKNENKTELYDYALDFYNNVIAPNFYNTQTKWLWQMRDKPLDFSKYVDFFGEDFAEFFADDQDVEVPFGGNFTSGSVIIEGSLSDPNCNFGFDLKCDLDENHIRTRIYRDQNRKYFIETAQVSENGIVDMTSRSNKIDAKDSLASFKLKLRAERSLKDDEENSILLYYEILSTDINGGEPISTPSFFKITTVSAESSRLSLYIGKNSKIRIRRISVEPFN